MPAAEAQIAPQPSALKTWYCVRCGERLPEQHVRLTLRVLILRFHAECAAATGDLLKQLSAPLEERERL